jgi:hypothetical protein
VIAVTILDVTGGQIRLVNLGKLRHLGPVGDARALLRERRQSGRGGGSGSVPVRPDPGRRLRSAAKPIARR